MALRWAGRSGRSQGLGRAPSTVSREIRRDGGSQAYRANRAVWRAWQWRCAPSLEDMPLSTLRVVALGATHPPRSTQLRRQLLLQHAAGLDEEAAIDRFVKYPHVWRVGNSCFSQPEIRCGAPSASGPPRLRIAPCRGIGKETFLPERTTRTSPPSSSAIPASRRSSRSPARTRRLLLLRALNQRPRKTLGFQTPADRLQTVLH